MITVRQGAPNDDAKIVSFQLAMAKEIEDLDLDAARLTAGVRAALADPTLGRYWLAEVDGEVVGCTQVTYEWSDWRNATVLWFQSVYVSPAYRRQGVFRALFEHVKGTVEGDDAFCGLRLYVDKRNRSAQEVYKKLGMDGEHYQMYEWLK